MAASASGVIGFARAASMDMPLAATFTIAMLAWYAWYESARKRYLALAYIFLGLAMLAKGPVAPFLAVGDCCDLCCWPRAITGSWRGHAGCRALRCSS